MIQESCWSKTCINTLFCRFHDNIDTWRMLAAATIK